MQSEDHLFWYCHFAHKLFLNTPTNNRINNINHAAAHLLRDIQSRVRVLLSAREEDADGTVMSDYDAFMKYKCPVTFSLSELDVMCGDDERRGLTKDEIAATDDNVAFLVYLSQQFTSAHDPMDLMQEMLTIQ